MTSSSSSGNTERAGITRHQWIVLAATTLGWALDGLDSSLFTLVVGSATEDLFASNGTPLSGAQLSFYTGLAVTIYLTGWALGAIALGALADYIGRVRVLMIGVLMYSVFTGLGGVCEEYWQFAVTRFLAGVGSGVELPIGAALMAEAWNNRHRAKATGIMMSGLAVGFFAATVVYRLVGDSGWRLPMVIGVIPALLVFFIRRYVHEPESMAAVKAVRAKRKAERAAGAARTTADRFVLVQLFTRPLLGRTVLATLITTGALFAFWGVTTWTPAVIRTIMAREGITGAAAIPYVSNSMALLYLGGAVGYAAWGFLADALGRKRTFAGSALIAMFSIGMLYPLADSYDAYLWGLPIVGFGVYSLFSGTAVYFPELFGPAVRASALAVTNSTGRLFTAAGPLFAGVIATHWFGGSLALAITAVSSFLVLTLIGLIPLPETHGSMSFAEDQLVVGKGAGRGGTSSATAAEEHPDNEVPALDTAEDRIRS